MFNIFKKGMKKGSIVLYKNKAYVVNLIGDKIALIDTYKWTGLEGMLKYCIAVEIQYLTLIK